MHDPLLTFLRDPRLANHAVGPAPAWLWTADGTRVLWANAAGTAVLGAGNPHALAERRLSTTHPRASEVVRLSGTLPHGGGSRLERLRSIGALGRTVICACSRFALANGTPAILVAANEPVGPALSLAERVARLFAGSEASVAAFAADGALLHATPGAAARLGDATSLADLGAEPLAAEARANGHTSGDSVIGPLTLERIGNAATAVLVAVFTDERLVTSEGDSPPAELEETPPTPDPSPPHFVRGEGNRESGASG